MKRILFLAMLVIIGVAFVCAGTGLYFYEFSNGTSTAENTEACPPPKKLEPLPNIDALASRMKYDQDVYRNVCDQAIAAYAKVHPVPHSYDDEARANLRLFTYLCIWDDYYGEGLWQQLDDHSDNLLREGDKQPIWQIFCDIQRFRTYLYDVDQPVKWNSHTVADALDFEQEMVDFGQTPYPALFKYAAYNSAMNNLVQCEGRIDVAQLKPLLPHLVDSAIQEYGEFIRSHYSHNFLFLQGRAILDIGKDDEDILKLISAGLDHAFSADDPDNPVAGSLDGEFCTDNAWCARGEGEADTVTPEGARLFGDRLGIAEKILTDLYAKHPDEAMIPDIMLRIMLGLGRPQDEMDIWFQRGIKADPNDFQIYLRKRRYLLPRWYGSDEKVQQFGLECAASDKWSAKIPMILVDCVADQADRDSSIFARPEIWQPVEKVYRSYLEQYPDSVYYRGRFAISAVQGEHWDVANEQFKILGSIADKSAFENFDFEKMKALAVEHAGRYPLKGWKMPISPVC